MSHLCIRLHFFLSLLVASSSCFAQFTSYKGEQKLLDHLAIHNLYTERLFLLNHLQDTTYSTLIRLEKAWTHHAMHDLDLSQKQYELVNFDSILHYNFITDYLNLLFKLNNVSKIKALTGVLPPNNRIDTSFMNSLTASINIVEMNYSINKIQNSNFPQTLQATYLKNITIQKKSAVLSGLYAALLPGSGKAYYGKKKEAWGAFAANLFFGIQAFESYKKAGAESFRFIFFTAGFSLFYVSNIYGSVTGLLKAKRDWKNQLHHEVSTHYFSKSIPNPLYH